MIKMTVTRCIIGGINGVFTKSPHFTKAMFLPATTTMEIKNCYSNKPKMDYTINPLTKSMTMLTTTGIKFTLEKSRENVDVGKAQSLVLSPNHETNQPMVVMLPWLMSRPKHYHKYAKLYLKLGFDVLTVSLSPWQLLWPVNGSQIVAKDLLRFLEVNNKLSPLLIHGFSVGGYLWGELLSHAERDRDRYSKVMNRISGHIWDSAADMQDIQVGFPYALFPKNTVLRKAFQSYIRYHMRTFYEAATQHYIRSSQMFHSTMVRAPALFLVSRRDPVGTIDSNTKLKENWDALGMTTYMKVWEKSPHVGHFRYYPEEYVAEVAAFLSRIQLLPTACKMQAKSKL